MVDPKYRTWLVRDKYDGKADADLREDLARVEKGEPLDYVIGWSDFCGCRIGLETHPLIPRPETKFWTEKAIREIGDRKLSILDIFAGSGCVGIAVLKHCPRATVDFIEKDPKLCEQIKVNCDLNGIDSKRYKISQTDVFKSFRHPVSKKKKYDFILANPPYVPEGRKLKKSVTEWEPAGALFAGLDGLVVINEFLEQAKEFLVPEGIIYLEFDSRQKTVLAKLLKDAGYKNIEFNKDQYGRWRFVTFQK
ncbi:MAG: peptide chain release factor N(5)-glutamine methyltransferase [Candidatus Vogelbacteria bacterium]|nr:peptide chain release factor N(5)-glutamine methyltransferase [Candidatus Vogelbacteria bacterium]